MYLFIILQVYSRKNLKFYDTFSRQLMIPGDCDMHMAVQCFVARAMSSRLQNPDWLYEYMDDAHEKELIGLLGQLPVAT